MAVHRIELGILRDKLGASPWSCITPDAYGRSLSMDGYMNRVQCLDHFVGAVNQQIID